MVSIATQNDSARRLPPLWWVKRWMSLRRLEGGGWQAWYRWRGDGWSATGDTRDAAGQELLDFYAGVKDGTWLAEYHARREA